MPLEPSSGLLKKFIKPDTSGPMRQPKPLDPSWIRNVFEGGLDTILGAIGVGPDTRMNRVGDALAGIIPVVSKASKLGKLSNIASKIPTQNRLAMGVNPTPTNGAKAIYDDAGRFLAMQKADDPAYLAHVASSRNKNVLPAKSALDPHQDILERMMGSSGIKAKNKLQVKSMEQSFVDKGK